MTKKLYTVVLQKIVIGDEIGSRSREKSGTLDELNKYFGQNAKSIKTLINRVQAKYSEREACCYNRTSVKLKEASKVG